MPIIDLAIKRPIAVLSIVLMVVLMGIVALNIIPIQLTPDIRKPIISVETVWPGAAPAEVEREIIVEQEAKGNNLLPTGFLRQLISFYGDNLQGVVPQYLDMTMQSFARNQEQMRSYMENAFGGMYPFSSFEEVGRKNMAMFEQAMHMMTPFNQSEDTDATEPAAENGGGADSEEALDSMKAQLEAMQKQLDTLSKSKKG